MVTAICLSGCNDYLEIVPKGKITLSTVDEVELLLNGGYSTKVDFRYLIMATNESINPHYSVKIPAILSNPPGLAYAYLKYDETVDRKSHTEHDDNYTAMYSYINISNTVLESIADAEGDNAKKTQLIAEARILRAYFHYVLANLFAGAYDPDKAEEQGGIPVVWNTNVAEVNKKVSLAAVYEKILEDCAEEVIKELPLEAASCMRPGRAFGYAVRAKVLLSMKNYPDAITAADNVLKINNNIENRPDYILSTGEHQTTKDTPNKLIYFYTGTVAPRFNSISAEWLEKYEEGDYIRYHTTTVTDKNINSYTGVPGTYYWGSRSRLSNFGITVEEVYLIKAECQARTNDIAGAMKSVNEVRKYRIHPDSYRDMTASTVVEAVKKISNVKQVELFGGYQNFVDIKRLNTESEYRTTISRTLLGETYLLPPDSDLWIMPFPIDAVANNPTLTHNY